MGKKKLDIDSPLLSTPTEPKAARRGRARNESIVRNYEGGNSAQEGLVPELTRFSVICKVQNVKRLKDYAYTKRISIKDATDEIIETFFNNYMADPHNERLLSHDKGKK